MTNTAKAIDDFKRLKSELEKCAQTQPHLNVGDTVVLRDGSSQTITAVKWEEATGKEDFYRWSSTFPYEIEHAAMGSLYEILDVIPQQ